MKYLWRRRVRSRAGWKRSMSSSIVGAGPAPSGVTTPGSVARRGSPAASSSRGVIASPSPRTIASSAPSACSSSSSAMNEPLWPPAKTKQPGRRRFVSFARSSTSGTLAR